MNENVEGARANARRWIARNFGPAVLPEDVAPSFLPDVVVFTVANTRFVDAATDSGRIALGLTPRDAAGEGFDRCRAVGARLYADKEAGVATRSAVTVQSEELVVFDTVAKRITKPGKRLRFPDWFTPLQEPSPSSRFSNFDVLGHQLVLRKTATAV